MLQIHVYFQDYSICSCAVCDDILLTLGNLYLFNVPQKAFCAMKNTKVSFLPSSLQDGAVQSLHLWWSYSTALVKHVGWLMIILMNKTQIFHRDFA